MPVRKSSIPAAAALAALALFAVSANIVPAALVRASREFGVAKKTLANAVAVQFAGFFLASVVGGILADRVGKKTVLQFGCVFLVAGALLWALAGSVRMTFVAGFVMGLGGGILESMSTALLSDLFPDKRKRALNMSQVGYCAGAVGGPALMGQLLPLGVSWRWFFAGIAVGGVLLLLLFTVSAIPKPCMQHRAQIAPSRLVRRTPLVLACVVIFLYVFAEMGVLTFMAAHLEVNLGAPERWAIFAISIFWSAMTLGRIICAFMPERHSYGYTITLLLGLSTVAILGQMFTDSWARSVILFGLAGFFFAGTWPLIVGMVAARSGDASGSAVGITVACGSLGCVAGPPVLGPLCEGQYPGWMFAVMAAALGLAIVVMLAGLAGHRH